VNNELDKQEIISLLEKIVLIECNKFYKDMDADLISECVDFLLELQDVEIDKEKVEKGRAKVIELMNKKAQS
jgi:hypothetical protein